MDPQSLSVAVTSPFNVMLDKIVYGGITQEELAEALDSRLVGLHALAMDIREYNFGK